MATKRKAFTLIELLISITILSLLMLALYKAYDALNISNDIYKSKSESIEALSLKKRTMYLDFALSLNESVRYLDQEPKEDIITMQTSNSIHKRYNPYVTYLTKDERLYRVESLQKVIEYPFSFDIIADIDEIGEVKKFKVFKSTKDESYMVDVRFKDSNRILMKVKSLNQM